MMLVPALSAARLSGRPFVAPPAGLTWAQLIADPGVTYHQDFSTPSAVTPFFFDNGQGEVAAGLISVDTTDGAETPNCLKIVTPASWGDGTNVFPQSAAFRHPLNSAWTLNSQSFGTTPFWIRWRMKVNSGRLVPSTPGLGWKFINLAQFSISDGGASGQSNTTTEIVGQDTLARGFPQAYHQDGTSFPPFEEDIGGGDFKLENGVDNGAGSIDNAHRYCLYSSSGAAFPGCFHWPVDEWIQMKMRVLFGTYGGSTGNQFDMWGARNGATAWTHLIGFGDNVALPFTLGIPQSGYSGSNGIHWHIYETGRVSSTQDAIVKYDGIIVSTNDVPLGQAA